MNTQYVVETHQLCKQYGKQYAVNHMDMHIKKGDIYGFIGRNGAGKSTTLKMIAGLIHSNFGEIKLFGGPSDNQIAHQRIGILIEEAGLYPHLNAYDNLMLSIRLIDSIPRKKRKQMIMESLEFVELSNASKKKVKNFSFGMKQRLALALSLITKPELLILDEPFVGLDPIGVEEVKELLQKLCREHGTAILFSSHQMQEVCDLTDNILVLSNGVISYSDQNTHVENQQAQLIEQMK